MAYKVKKTGATLKKLVTERTSNRDPSVKVPIYEEKVYFEGDIVQDEDIAEIHKRQLDAGEGNIGELIERVEETAKKSTPKKRSTKKSTTKQD